MQKRFKPKFKKKIMILRDPNGKVREVSLHRVVREYEVSEGMSKIERQRGNLLLTVRKYKWGSEISGGKSLICYVMVNMVFKERLFDINALRRT